LIKLIELGKVTSTNDELKALAENGAPHFTAVTAETQTKGRGRYDRVWESPKGNLYISVLFREKLTPLISYIGALSVREAIGKGNIKWPNDILVKGKKVAGILLEAVEGEYIILGIGINIAAAPEYAGKVNDDIKKIRDILLARIWHNFKEFKQHGFGQIRNKWLEHAAFLGEEIKVNLPNSSKTGIFLDLTEEGELKLKTKDGEELISSGEIYATSN
jgi:BirA family biotin operon repressor/biotin-[acetyl-CoA-carboxylase] ligase